MKDWTGKRVLIIGAARQGTSLARYLATHGADVVLNDNRPASLLQEARERLAGLPVGWVLGDHPVTLLEDVDLVCPSGGVPLDLPLLAEARRRGIALSNDSQVFLELAPCRTIGITGSAGKTTTTTLVGRILEASGVRKTWVGGNIGNPLIDAVDQISPDDLAVIELSSFQLDLMSRSPQIAAVLNLSPNHLDRHGTMAAYTAAKANILRFQRADDVAVIGRADPNAMALEDLVQGRLFTFGLEPPKPGRAEVDAHVQKRQVILQGGGEATVVMPVEAVELPGQHNLLNVLAACAIAAAAGAGPEAMQTGVSGFQGVPHRLEFVRRWGEADWYNDSIATAPERALAGLRSFDGPIVLLAGGRDKDLPWEEFAEEVARRVDHLVTFGETAEMIAEKVKAVKGAQPETISSHERLLEAIQAAAIVVSPGDVVLLSPGGTSFDEFKDFAERGECFKRWVSDLA